MNVKAVSARRLAALHFLDRIFLSREKLELRVIIEWGELQNNQLRDRVITSVSMEEIHLNKNRKITFSIASSIIFPTLRLLTMIEAELRHSQLNCQEEEDDYASDSDTIVFTDIDTSAI